ncbi:MAG: hypothetical protein KDD36_06000 [Flavobacteriales bacterium]|nr:hypothetical protein [Flavobacteriales bacterium]
MKKYYVGLASALFLMACAGESSEETNPELEKMRLENIRLNQVATEKDSLLTAYFGTLDEIEGNLNTIKAKEGLLVEQTSDRELRPAQQEQIIADIQLIQELMQKNKEKIASMSSKLSRSNVQIEALNKRIEKLVEQIQQKDAEISKLQQELFKVNDKLEMLFNEYNQRIQELSDKESELNSAWYAYGSYKELSENGILTKEGGFIGIGRMKKLMSNFNKDYFRKIDIREMPEIPLYVKTAKLISSHPDSSYEWQGEDGKVDKLLIKDPDAFWSSSKYLVILVE